MTDICAAARLAASGRAAKYFIMNIREMLIGLEMNVIVRTAGEVK